MELVAMLPWWLGAILAVASYLALHSYAGTPAEAVNAKPGQMGTLAASAFLRGLAGYGQYLLPLLCLVGATISAVRRHQRAALLHDVATGDGAAALSAMTWQQFELIVGEWFRQQGYAVKEQGGAGPDGGIDLRLKKGNETLLVQCKQWRATKVGVTVVRELYGVMAAEGATGGFVITSGSFTKEAQAFADGRNLHLINGDQLARIVQGAAPQWTPAPITASPIVAPQVDRSTPHCPLCGLLMVGRVAKRGTNAGQRFWGCSSYPACKGAAPG